MTLASIALMLAAGLVGPALASWKRGSVPVAVGELLVGVLLGPSVFHLLPANDITTTTLSSIGFALVMLVVGSHLNVHAFADHTITLRALQIVGASAVVALGAALVVRALTGFENIALLAALMASSSAAIILPVLQQIGAADRNQLLITHVTIADLLSIVMLPIVMHSPNVTRTIMGAGAIALLGVCFYLLLRYADHHGSLQRLHEFSKSHAFGLELRISLVVVIGLSAVAGHFQVTVMIAGFSVGIALAAVGVPRRLARQLFGITEGFFSPIFFVILGSQIDVRAAVSNANTLLLAAALSIGTICAHATARLFGERLHLALMSGAQLGVPVAAVTIGQASGELTPAQSAAILASALVSIMVTTIASERHETPAAPAPTTPPPGGP